MWPGWDSYSPLSVSLVVAQRLRKLDFPVKDSEEPSTPGADKNHFLRPREDTGKVSAADTPGLSPSLAWAEVWVEGSQRGSEARSLPRSLRARSRFEGHGSVFL